MPRAVSSGRKSRITKGRLVCAIMLAPVFYVLNAGPMTCVSNNVPATRPFVEALYRPLNAAPTGGRVGDIFEKYLRWWGRL
jgi:hypothetical protein